MGCHSLVTTRAKTRRSTSAAPPRNNARAAALAVAPEVRTSSTRMMRAPRSGAAARRETPLDVLRPLLAGQSHLAARRLDAQEPARLEPCAAHRRNGPRERSGLIEAPPPQAQRMQRHRHDCVGLQEQVGPRPRHPGAERSGEIAAIGIFEPVDQAARGPILEARDCARATENRRIGDRLRRQKPLAEILLEGDAKPLAEGSLNEPRRPPAGGAEPPCSPVAARQARQVGGKRVSSAARPSPARAARAATPAAKSQRSSG